MTTTKATVQPDTVLSSSFDVEQLPNGEFCISISQTADVKGFSIPKNNVQIKMKASLDDFPFLKVASKL